MELQPSQAVYTFQHRDPEARRVDVKEFSPFEETWSEVLEEFLKFLSAVYGYDIASKVTFDKQ